jgi:anti-anti-sigma regulatory factor
MLDIDVTTVLDPRPTTWVRLDGPLATPDQAHALRQAIALLPIGMPTVLDLSGATLVSQAGIVGLGHIADDVAADRGHLVVVCPDLDVRARLVLADVDVRATLLHSNEQARLLVTSAA